jgi:hypothetical protein
MTGQLGAFNSAFNSIATFMGRGTKKPPSNKSRGWKRWWDDLVQKRAGPIEDAVLAKRNLSEQAAKLTEKFRVRPGQTSPSTMASTSEPINEQGVTMSDATSGPAAAPAVAPAPAPAGTPTPSPAPAADPFDGPAAASGGPIGGGPKGPTQKTNNTSTWLVGLTAVVAVLAILVLALFANMKKGPAAMAALDTKVTTLDTKVDQIAATTKATLAAQDSKIAAHGTEIAGLKSAVATNASGLKALDDKVKALKPCSESCPAGRHQPKAEKKAAAAAPAAAPVPVVAATPAAVPVAVKASASTPVVAAAGSGNYHQEIELGPRVCVVTLANGAYSNGLPIAVTVRETHAECKTWEKTQVRPRVTNNPDAARVTYDSEKQ